MIDAKQGPLSVMQPIVSTSLSFLKVFKLNGRGIKIKSFCFLRHQSYPAACLPLRIMVLRYKVKSLLWTKSPSKIATFTTRVNNDSIFNLVWTIPLLVQLVQPNGRDETTNKVCENRPSVVWKQNLIAARTLYDKRRGAERQSQREKWRTKKKRDWKTKSHEDYERTEREGKGKRR